MEKAKLFVSVDVDDWYFARWASGSQNALWPDLESLSQDIYNQPFPPNNLKKELEHILALFKELKFTSTFFITGFMAEKFPSLVGQIVDDGHELACHNYYHLDYEYESPEKFSADLLRSKNLLEELSGQRITGYRSPNSSIPRSLVSELIKAGFEYDSSVTPTRRIMGKFGDHVNAPRQPYFTDPKDIGKAGNSTLLEIPWSVFPYIQFPAGSSIMHRIAGNTYNNIATRQSLNKGHTSYYFHPYELSELEEIKGYKLPFKAKIFLRNTGAKYKRSLRNFLKNYQDQLINGSSLVELIKSSTP